MPAVEMFERRPRTVLLDLVLDGETEVELARHHRLKEQLFDGAIDRCTGNAPADNATHPCCPGCSAATPPIPDAAPHPGGPPAVSRPRRLPWAELLRRVFAEGVLQCACGGRRTVVAFVADATLTRSLLTSLGRPAEPATFAPARAPPQAKLARYDPA